jgi:hypothetical protein
MREDFSSRLSFSCARCRTRSTSLSVRFLGRRVYLALAVVLVSDSGRGSTSASAGAAAKLGAELGVPRQSLKRWRNWWSEQFPLTPLWRATCARFMPAVDVAELPAALLGRFAGSLTESVMRMLVFLSPVTLRDGGPGGPGGPGVIEVFEGR